MNTERISYTTGGFLIGVAVLVDILDFILALGFFGFIIDAPATLFFGIAFSHVGVSMMDGDRVLKFLSTSLIEAVPIFDDFPAWTYTVASTVWREWHTFS